MALVPPLQPRSQFAAAFAAMAQQLQRSAAGEASSTRTALFRPLPADPMAWLLETFPTYFQNSRGEPLPLAAHHTELWQWLWALRPGEAASTFIAVWSRGGGKSTSVELGSAALGYFGLRRYALYICNTQQQADDHLATVATALEQLGVDRAINKYGVSRGWRVNRLRSGDGFTMDAVGMDTAIRGVRIDEARPDLIILDDLDDQSDTDLTIQKKIATLTRKILPTGASSMTVLGVQNLPNLHGIFAQLTDGRAEFLLDRTLSGPYPALRDLPATDWYRQEPCPEGPTRIRLTAGTPMWAGQGLAECEALIAKIGPTAFLIECQHQVALLEGDLFKRHWFPIVPDWPREAQCVRAWDFASTAVEVGSRLDPDWTVGLLVAAHRGQYWIVDMQRMRGSPHDVEALILQTAQRDGRSVAIWLAQEPGSSGKIVVDDYQRRVLSGFPVYAARETGSKADRAKPASAAAEAGNVFLVDGPWVTQFLEELPLFGLPGVHDDIVDALSGAFAALATLPALSGLSLTPALQLRQPSLTARAVAGAQETSRFALDDDSDF
jgi:predicted phage terminase large subunit-like protein